MSDPRSIGAFIDAHCPGALPYQREMIEAALAGRRVALTGGLRASKQWTTDQIRGHRADIVIVDEEPLTEDELAAMPRPPLRSDTGLPEFR